MQDMPSQSKQGYCLPQLIINEEVGAFILEKK